jgi:hypothetical protein
LDEKEKISLSKDLKYWRAERPDEWTMDRFIQKAEALEMYAQKNIVKKPSTSTNKESSQLICCLGINHKCMMNVNEGYCADGAGKCQYKVRIN